jgi:hypothetical protein
MLPVYADDSGRVKNLGLFFEPVEIWDASGKLLGVFVPANMERCKQQQAEFVASIDWAEIHRRQQDPGPREPLERTLLHLKQVDQESERRKAAGERPMTTDEAMAFYRELRRQAQEANGAPSSTTVKQETDACASR